MLRKLGRGGALHTPRDGGHESRAQLGPQVCLLRALGRADSGREITGMPCADAVSRCRVLSIEIPDGTDEPHGGPAPVDDGDTAEHACTSPLN
jgi:hypothetical protein